MNYRKGALQIASKHLTLIKFDRIEHFIELDLSIRKIAEKLGRSL